MATTNNSSSIVMKRKATNSSGRLGSLYDGCRDHVIRLWKINVQGQRFKSSKLAQCELIRGNTDMSRNILRTIGIEDDLRLSLLLNLTQKIGISAILNYPYRINEYTRILFYSWIDREEQISNEILKDLKLDESMNPTTSATHVITGISYGIDVIVVLKLLSETDIITEIDRILQKIRRSLFDGNDIVLTLTSEENDLLTKTIKVTVYSNIPDLTGLTEVSKLFYQIDQIKKNSNQYSPITYSLRSLASLHPQHPRKSIIFHTLPPELNNNVEQYLLHKRAIITNLKISFQENVLKCLSGYLEGRLYGAYKQYSHMKKKYLVEIERLSKLVIGFRSGQVEISVIKDALFNNEQTTLKNDNNELAQNLNDLKAKAYLISDLLNQNFIYWNVDEHNVNKRDDERSIQNKLIMNNQSIQILCSNDTLNKENHQQLNKLLSNLIEEREKNPNLRLIYADFSYCSYKLHNMMVLSSNNRLSNRNVSMQKSRSPFINSQSSAPRHINVPPPALSITKTHNSTKSLPTDEIINIVLLGETGVGKSTFINAFANYLTFNSLGQAESNKPIVIIPVSFLITVGDNFEERTVKYGEFNSSNNEDFNHPGQSVTQHCKSYVFNLKKTGKKLRIIDTPGFGDTRGLDQDDHNMEHILQYINNLTHLNAICFLLKPNASRLNIFFRTCFTQLFSLLSPNARQNIIFCFTNGRSTFYTPGNTAPLVKTMLASSSMNDISFKKENTFCFDSESFRYLVAVRNKISFNEEDKREYEMSWSTSVKESNRLIDYIHRKLTPYYIRSGWQSIKHAQFEISHMIRPMLETMRNILRNLILYKMNPPKVSIELRPKPILRPIAICFSCKRHPIQVSYFWIMPDIPHEFQKKCRTCSCTTTNHNPIDYELDYKAVNNPSRYQQNEMTDMLHRLYFASAEFSYFLIHGACSTKDDLFMLGLLRMIREEKDICHEKESNQMNLQLTTELEEARHQYEQRLHEVASNQGRKTLTIIYEQIKTICNYSEIREQMAAVKQGQDAIMKQHEVVL